MKYKCSYRSSVSAAMTRCFAQGRELLTMRIGFLGDFYSRPSNRSPLCYEDQLHLYPMETETEAASIAFAPLGDVLNTLRTTRERVRAIV